MSDPYIKAIPDQETGNLHFVMDQAGFDLFRRLLSRATPIRTDSPKSFNEVRDRVSGAFMTGGIIMGWERKK